MIGMVLAGDLSAAKTVVAERVCPAQKRQEPINTPCGKFHNTVYTQADITYIRRMRPTRQ